MLIPFGCFSSQACPAVFWQTLSEKQKRGLMRRQKRTILCVDDERNILDGLKALLELKGYDVLIATSGRQGLDLFASRPVDGVVLDYEMPEMNGDAVAAQMKEIKPHVPILLLSAHDRLPKSKLKAVDAFLLKGQPPAIFLWVVDDLVNVRFPFFYRWLGEWKRRKAA